MKRAARLLLAVAAAGAAATPSAPAAGQGTTRVEPPARGIHWLSLGDSYGSGEGATGAVGHCQRSPNAAGPKAVEILRTERRWQIASHTFAACTGYHTADLFNSRDELQMARATIIPGSGAPDEAPAGSEIRNDHSLYAWAVAQGAPTKGVDVIVSSLGGNDIGFGEIIMGCTDVVRRIGHGANSVLPLITLSPWEAFARVVAVPRLIDRADPPGCGDVVDEELHRRIRALFTGSPFPSSPSSPGGGQRGSLLEAYRAAADDLLSSDGVFIVLGYPRLLTPTKTWGAWRGNQCNFISRADADRLSVAAEEFDRSLRSAVEALGPRFAYISRLDVFDNSGDHRSLCSRGVEWLNTPLAFLRDGTLRPERGFHPNDLGYLATAEHIAGVVESHLGTIRTPAPASPAPTPSPTVRSSEPHFDIGEPFAARCVIAWPTAPSRGTGSIQMRTSCSGVPTQFQFVDIVYPDPDLPVSPSRSSMDVRGEIVDIVRSEFGFTVLVVFAYEIVVR